MDKQIPTAKDADEQTEDKTETTQTATDDCGQETGNVTTADGSKRPDGPESNRAREARARKLALSVTKRLTRESRWAGQIETERDEMMRLARKGPAKMSKVDAQLFVYSELARLYQPLPKTTTDTPDTTKIPEQNTENRTLSYPGLCMRVGCGCLWMC